MSPKHDRRPAEPEFAIRVGAVLAAVVLLAAASPLSPFRDGPPAAVTGGFGEDSCIACHFGSEPNEPGGKLVLAGVPERYEAGEAYRIQVRLIREGMGVGGFQLAARFEGDGSQAGSLGSDPERGSGRIGVQSHGGVQYAQHTLGGIVLSTRDSAHWTLLWTAPETGGAVTFHAAAVAGDNDESQFGDYVYTTEQSATGPKRR